ncbi:MAG: alpha/beta hydrolase [Acidimicrobiales bacterium]
MIGALFAITAGLGFAAALVANVRVRPVIIGLPSTIAGFFAAELARVQIVLHLSAAALWIAAGALDDPAGVAGAAFAVLAVALLELAHRRALATEGLLRTAFPEQDAAPMTRRLLGVVPPSFRGVEIRRDLTYGPHRRNRADLYLPARPTSTPTQAPIVLQVHGGGWVSGNKRQQGQPLLSHFTRQGWIGVAIDYRLGPRHRLPACVHDVKRAIAWIRANAEEWGGDADRILLTGGSAGGHLTALCALTADDAMLQPGFEHADCTVAAAAPIYGVFDLLDRNNRRGRMKMTPFLQRMVMESKLADDQETWDALSPVSRVRADAPPMLAISGAYDTLVPIEEARDFGAAITSASASARFVELPHAHHAFDVINGPRARAVVATIERWATGVMAKGAVDA